MSECDFEDSLLLMALTPPPTGLGKYDLQEWRDHCVPDRISRLKHSVWYEGRSLLARQPSLFVWRPPPPLPVARRLRFQCEPWRGCPIYTIAYEILPTGEAGDAICGWPGVSWDCPAWPWWDSELPWAWFSSSFITTTSASNQTTTNPSDWVQSGSKIETIGTGGNGGNGAGNSDGGGGGGYNFATNVALTPSASATFFCKANGTGTTSAGTVGPDCWYNGTSLAASSCGSKGGGGGSGTGTGGSGGAFASGVPSGSGFNGGAGGSNTGNFVCAGGGAAGPNGTGATTVGSGTAPSNVAGAGGGGAGGGASGAAPTVAGTGGKGGNSTSTNTYTYGGWAAGTGGAGGTASVPAGVAGGAGAGGGGGGNDASLNASNGRGGDGGDGTDWSASFGSGGGSGAPATNNNLATPAVSGKYGGGGAAHVNGASNGSTGAQGIIVLTWTPSVSSSITARAAISHELMSGELTGVGSRTIWWRSN